MKFGSTKLLSMTTKRAEFRSITSMGSEDRGGHPVFGRS